jgi:hypothetical protein
VLISAVDGKRDPLPQRLLRPDLVGEREEVLDRLGYGRRLLDLALAEVSQRR